MAHTYEELKHMPVAQLREIAAGIGHEAVQGYTQMNKDHLLPALCQALGIEMHAHHEVVGVDKTGIKKRIHDLKHQRDDALQAHDHGRLKAVRREIHDLKREIRKATV
jgi:hypothetical protein